MATQAPPSAPVRPASPAGNGADAKVEVPPRRARRRSLIRLLLPVLAVLAVLAGGLLAYRWWYDSTHFVTTDNAQVAGRLVQVGTLTAGRVASVRFDVGAAVNRDDIVATVNAPVLVGTTSNGANRFEYRNTDDSLVDIRSPVSGIVVATNATAGDSVPVGQSILTVVDPQQLWVSANIDETQVRKLRIGQRATVHFDAQDVDLEGQVAAITPASAGTFSLLPTQNYSGNYTKVTQLVPVKIVLDRTDPGLMIGTSVEVRIRVRD